MTDARLADYERQFRRAGLPLLIEDYRAREDIFTRGAPLLFVVFVAELAGAVNLDLPVWANLLAELGAIALVVAALGLLNRLRGRPFFSLPRRVDVPELAAFVVVPALLPLLGGQTTSAWVTAVVNLAIIGLVYLVVGYGLISIVRLAAGGLLGELARSLLLLTRALPLLLVFALLIFLTTEVWQVAATMPDAFAISALVLLVAIGVLFIVARLPREVARLAPDPPLQRRQRLNVALVMFISQSLQVLVVSLGVGAFFVVFGLLLVGPEVRQDWIGGPGQEVLAFDLFGERLTLTEELLRVAGGIAAVSGLYYAIAVLTDSTYREEFLHEVTGELAATFAARREYLSLRARLAE